MKLEKLPKKIIPFIIAIICIVLVIIIGVASGIMEKYSYSSEKMDLNAYYQIYGENQVPILLKDEILQEKGLNIEGALYIPLNTVQNYLNSRFFYDKNEGLFLYTTPTEVMIAIEGESSYTVNGESNSNENVIGIIENEEPYLSLEFVKKYTNFESYVYNENGPTSIQIYNEEDDVNVSTIKKDTNVRYQGGIKSPILREVLEGEEVVIIEKMEKWSEVKTSDSIIGYVENKFLVDERSKKRTIETRVEVKEYTSLKKDYKINLVWHLVTNADANQKVYSLLEQTKGLNTISPTWFALNDNEGNFTSLADKGYVDAMHERGLEVWALVDNFTGRINDEMIDTALVLSYTSKRTRLISGLIEQVNAYGIDGINVDFEQVPREAGEEYVQFLRELSVACRNNGIILSIDNYVPTDYTEFYNRTEQGIIADYIMIMGYDEHYSAEDIGSVASINFVEKGIQDTINEVPSEKVINALPFYTAIWASTGDASSVEKVGMSAAENFMAQNNGTAAWDEETCQNYTMFQNGDTVYQIWLEDEQSIATKLNVMKNYDLGGVAGWRLGLEKQGVWDLISEYTQ